MDDLFQRLFENYKPPEKDLVGKLSKFWGDFQKYREEDPLNKLPSWATGFAFGPTKIVDVPWWKALIGDTVKHGGAKVTPTFDPSQLGRIGQGEPGSLRPLGKAFYTSNADQIAKLYLKYGGKNPTLNTFKIQDDTVLFPKGSLWKYLSPEERDYYKMLSNNAAKNLGEKYITDAFAPYRRNQEDVRKILVDSGIDGMVEQLGNPNFYEVGFYNPQVLRNIWD